MTVGSGALVPARIHRQPAELADRAALGDNREGVKDECARLIPAQQYPYGLGVWILLFFGLHLLQQNNDLFGLLVVSEAHIADAPAGIRVGELEGRIADRSGALDRVVSIDHQKDVAQSLREQLDLLLLDQERVDALPRASLEKERPLPGLTNVIGSEDLRRELELTHAGGLRGQLFSASTRGPPFERAITETDAGPMTIR